MCTAGCELCKCEGTYICVHPVQRRVSLWRTEEKRMPFPENLGWDTRSDSEFKRWSGGQAHEGGGPYVARDVRAGSQGNGSGASIEGPMY